MKTIELHIFTNSSYFAPSIRKISRTYKSFNETFNHPDIEVFVYMDSNPNIEKSEEYFKALKQIFPFVIKTNSLSHSYLTAIQNSKADFLFMLEHDWTFIKKRIHHNLDEIILEFPNIIHLRFNKMKNHSNSWESIEEKLNSGYPYCETDMLSNNPHIIKRLDYHIATKDLLVIESGSFGIEEKVSNRGIGAGIYGGYGYKKTIKHTDGRNNIFKRLVFMFFLDILEMINEKKINFNKRKNG